MAGDLRGLNWGCGPEWRYAMSGGRSGVTWYSSDVVDYGQEHVGSILDGLPCADGFFDGIVSNHSLQALTVHEIPAGLAEMHRVLRPGGHLRVLVPDVMAAVEAWFDGDETWPGFTAISEPWTAQKKFAHYLTWGGQNRTCFMPATLAEALDVAGFEPCSWRPWLAALDSREGESLITEVRKPHAAPEVGP